jgi:predicted dehydrogenase
MSEKVIIGIIGCGNISRIYLEQARTFDILEVKAVADMDTERAKAKAKEQNVPNVFTVDELLADDEIEIVVNLTPPSAHAEIGLRAIDSGKSVYNEKPLAIFREEAFQMIKNAAEKGRGVMGMKPRIEALGGDLQVTSEPGPGVVIEARVPLPRA